MVSFGGNERAGITPCMLVVRGVYEASLAGAAFEVTLTLTYASGGTPVTKTFVFELDELELHQGHPRANDAQYAPLMAASPFDVSDQPVDAGSAFEASIEIAKIVGTARERQGNGHTGQPEVR